jgi:hypothetical protein
MASMTILLRILCNIVVLDSVGLASAGFLSSIDGVFFLLEGVLLLRFRTPLSEDGFQDVEWEIHLSSLSSLSRSTSTERISS